MFGDSTKKPFQKFRVSVLRDAACPFWAVLEHINSDHHLWISRAPRSARASSGRCARFQGFLGLTCFKFRFLQRPHLAYGLRVPVLTSSMEARQAPLRYLNAVEAAFRAKLQADDGFSGLITKNPAHPLWRTLQGPDLAYELGDLAEWVDLEHFKPRQGVKVAEVGLGRNVTVFDFVRLWAYKKVREYKNVRGGFVHWQKAVYDRCMARNGDFAHPMDNREAYHIARSVAKWTWQRFDLEASDARFSKLQALRVSNRWENSLQNQIRGGL